MKGTDNKGERNGQERSDTGNKDALERERTTKNNKENEMHVERIKDTSQGNGTQGRELAGESQEE